MHLVKELLSPSLALQIIVLMSFFLTKFFEIWLFFPSCSLGSSAANPDPVVGAFRRILVW
jgi:hypothetical protein